MSNESKVDCGMEVGNLHDCDMPADCITCPQVPHIQQHEDWDCGLACAKMILNFIHAEVEDRTSDFENVCGKLGFGESIWTIDVAHLIVQYNVKHRLCTVTLGVDSTYQEMNFYNQVIKGEFTAEQQRVNQLFTNAASKGMVVEQRSITIGEIVAHLSSQNPAVILVDSTILHCEWCMQHSGRKGCGDCLPFSDTVQGVSYIGHFIVLCGVNITKKQFLYRNPAISEELCCCSFDNLDEARRSHGTDEDILFIYR